MAFETRGPEPGEAYGSAAVTQALGGVDFPASKDELISMRGDRDVQVEKGEHMKLREILQRLPQDNFDSMADLVSALRDVM